MDNVDVNVDDDDGAITMYDWYNHVSRLNRIGMDHSIIRTYA